MLTLLNTFKRPIWSSSTTRSLGNGLKRRANHSMNLTVCNKNKQNLVICATKLTKIPIQTFLELILSEFRLLNYFGPEIHLKFTLIPAPKFCFSIRFYCTEVWGLTRDLFYTSAKKGNAYRSNFYDIMKSNMTFEYFV